MSDKDIIDFDQDESVVVETRTERQIKKSMKKKEKSVSIGREIASFAIYIIVAIALSAFILMFVGQRTVVVGESMMNTLHDQESIIVDKISYRFKDPERFDIIVFPYQEGKNTNYIKRIIGLPGETVQIKDQKIYINGELLEESYGRELIDKNNYGRAEEPIKLGDDEYFVLGDNRNNSMDSRTSQVGNVKRSIIIGRAWLRCWPFDKFGFIRHQ